MKVRLAKTAGFCMGVKRAMEIVLSEANRANGPIFTLGPLIHNQQVMDLLESKGVIAVEDPTGLKEGSIVIRAHGIAPGKRYELKNTGLRVIDATCPKVVRVQSLVRYHTKKGCSAIIVGDPDHAEVIGIVGYSEGPVHVIRGPDEIKTLSHMERPLVVAQTTQNRELFRKVADAVIDRFPNAIVHDTVCDATSVRQTEVKAFAGSVECLVVVGGFHSGNTRRLVEVARSEGIPVQHVETEKDLNRDALKGMKVVGLTAGASTPNWMIRSVAKELESIRGERESKIGTVLRSAFRFLLLSNLFVSGGAASLTLAAALLSGAETGWIYPSIAFCYIHAMHVLNVLLDKRASAYNDPERSSFIADHRIFLILMGVFSILAALVFSFLEGINTFFFAGALSLVGILYGIPLIPSFRQGRRRLMRIKDIPGSRSLAEALGVVAVTTILPSIDRPSAPLPATLITSVVFFLMAYSKAGLFEIFRVQGDLIVGTESLPITLGEKRALTVLKLALAGAMLTLVLGFLSGFQNFFAFFMLLPILLMCLCLFGYEKRWVYPGLGFEALSEGPFYLSGVLAALKAFFS
ncbi:MAG: 4-hydroxy-3-methylbut-2-enyl diphosphate reductase [Desulfobacteraceae bacterium]|nr:MAG: 4-hydroxy-3-methylbut-2-enyl diphosphate reductase [Desulfobacteraceae bacterium]